jgi:hypothetical protein
MTLKQTEPATPVGPTDAPLPPVEQGNEGQTQRMFSPMFTLVQHHEYVYGGQGNRKEMVQVVPVDNERVLRRVEAAEGVLFPTWEEASALRQAANEYAIKAGVLAGGFSAKLIGEARVYIPKREAVA